MSDRRTIFVAALPLVVVFVTHEGANGSAKVEDVRLIPSLQEVAAWRLKPGDVTVWWMEVDTVPKAVVAEWSGCLDATEQAKADGFIFDEDRSTYIAAHWLIRNALASIGGLPPGKWRFIEEMNGKPAIDPALGRPEICFNLSHTKGLVACAVGVGATIGIDVEAVSLRRRSLDIARRFFNPSEVDILHGVAPDRQPRAFARLWTLKEALIKATGEGMRRSLKSFSFSLDPARLRLHPDDENEAATWQFFEYQPTSRHLLALAARPPDDRPLNLSVRRVSSAFSETTCMLR